MIFGTGIDIIEVSRIRASCERFGERFVHRILRASEIQYCQSHREPSPFVAARFAAKEAVSKAFGTGIGARLGWLDIEIARHHTGQPYVILHDRARALHQQVDGGAWHLSLSHTEFYAAAVAILETREA